MLQGLAQIVDFIATTALRLNGAYVVNCHIGGHEPENIQNNVTGIG